MATLVNAGRAIITNLVSGLGGTVPKFIAIGTGGTAESATQTALVTEVETRATGTVTRTTTSVTNDTVQVVGTITPGTARAVTEAGLFDVVTTSSGNMLMRSLFSVINLNGTGDSLQITATLQFT